MHNVWKSAMKSRIGIWIWIFELNMDNIASLLDSKDIFWARKFSNLKVMNLNLDKIERKYSDI